MSRHKMYVFCLAVFVILITFHMAYAQKIYRADERPLQRENKDEISVSATNQLSTISPVQWQVFPLKPGKPIRRVVVSEDSGSIAGNTDKLVYSNTLGINVLQIPAQNRITDDLSLNAPAGCELSRFTFQVVGRANPDDMGGPFRVDYALYEFCPGTGGPVISGTQGFIEFADDLDDVIQQVEIVIPADQSINLLPNIWLGLTTSRDNVGIVMGALPLIGFSEDIVDYPGFACNADIGKFPRFGHASFNTEVYVRDDCADTFLGYYNVKAFQRSFSKGSDILIADDIELGVESCEMVGYEVGVRGPGLYTFSLRVDDNGIPGSIIENTRKLFVHAENNVRVVHFPFFEPIRLDKNLWATFKVNNNIGGWINTESSGSWGRTTEQFAIFIDQRWKITSPFSDPSIPNFGGFYLTIHCAGQPPVGACCDMYFGECTGGHDKGNPCRINDDCKNPGTCEAICREVPEMNCSFPLRGLDLQPKWVEGFTCDPDPFPFTCGVAACCRPDDICENLTKNECDDVEPVDDTRQWQIGKYCDEQLQVCPFIACLRRVGDCVVAHDEPGCERPFCCQDVCEADPYCCLVEWDRQCVFDVALFCYSIPPANDECNHPRDGHGALEVAATSSTVSHGINATTNENDPVYCCHTTSLGSQGFGTVWYKFVATHSSISISTVDSEFEQPSLIQVYEVGDSSTNETSCNSLIPIACHDDDSIYVLVTDNFSKISLDQLTIGDTYYVEVAGKNRNDTYRLQMKSPHESNQSANNFCNDADMISDGEISYNLFNNTGDCLARICTYAQRDVWFDYTATCTGNLIITPCMEDFLPDKITVIDGCDCKNTNEVLFCGFTIGDDFCENVEPIKTAVIQDHCYKIQIGDRLRTSGQDIMLIECIRCDPGPVEWIDPPQNTVDARRPHPYYNSCEICLDSIFDFFEGMDRFKIQASQIFQPQCWDSQITNINKELHILYNHSKFPELVIENIEQIDNDSHSINMSVALTPGEIFSLTYTDYRQSVQTAQFNFLPGDVDGNLTVCIEDVESLINILEGTEQPQWGRYSADIDHSGAIKPADLLTLIDLMNGSGGYSVWLNASLDENQLDCP